MKQKEMVLENGPSCLYGDGEDREFLLFLGTGEGCLPFVGKREKKCRTGHTREG